MKEFEVAFPVRAGIPSDEYLHNAAAKAMGIPVKRVKHCSLLRRSLDARSKEILYRYRVIAYSTDEIVADNAHIQEYKMVEESEPVIVVGAGPAGLFAALKLLQNGLKPIILERGKNVHERKYDIASLSRERVLNGDSNYCFGEGGAGTFSDGKLYTRSNKRGEVSEVLNHFVEFGADESILMDAHPHIGSDKLPGIIEGIRNCIVGHGGEYHFGAKVTDIKLVSGIWNLTTAGGEIFSAKNVILATGHSAKDIYENFASKGWALERKGFAMGVRVEHPQMQINQIQYHGNYQPYLPAAEYSLVTQVDGRGVFSFCMCPGGMLVPSMTSPETLVLNGMSNSMRNSKWANAGIVVQVEPEDVDAYMGSQASNPLAVLDFQEMIERRAFEVSSSIKAPAQLMTDFVRSKYGVVGKDCLSVSLPKSSYIPGTISAPLHDILPDFVASRLKKAFPLFDKKMKGYYTSQALLLAVESRTSSPVRIPRNPDTLQHISLSGLYPCGEGAGYAGGIVSSALDGINCAAAIARQR